MTYLIPPDSPRSRLAVTFGRELRSAMDARDVPNNEMTRVLGFAHATLWNYLNGRSLPKVAQAAAIAQMLDWPKLRTIVVEARTRTCRREGCGHTFINDVGSEQRRYCTPDCARIVTNQRQAETRARSAGQTADPRTRRAHVARLRAAVRHADARAARIASAVAAMCAGCEPDGLCRQAACPLRPVSPLPLGQRPSGVPRTGAAIRAEAAARAAPGRRASMLARHAEPGFSERLAAASRARHPARGEGREAWIESIRVARRAS